jgi:peroxiredoxin
LLVGVGGWLGYQLVLQNGRILLMLEALEQRSGPHKAEPARPAGLPAGSAAPDFELPDLNGDRRALAQFRGREVLLVFFNPGCGYCTKMAADLAALPPEGGDGRPVPLVVTAGDAEANRRLVEEYRLRCPVLLQAQREVASQYQARGTPSGYLIDEQGMLASDLAVGAPALLALAVVPRNAKPAGPREQGAGRECGCGKKLNGKASKGLVSSRLNRSGLKAGTPAPAFRLPRLDGGELSLQEYRGRRLLLVFSDPECGPCEQLAPGLERLHRNRPDLAILMVSRRDPEANRRKVAELGLTFPVALQKSWEVSLLYEIFAPPVGYLIDEQGVIAADVARGVEPILALISGADASGMGAVETTRSHAGKEVALI